jgi:hypothetical protein
VSVSPELRAELDRRLDRFDEDLAAPGRPLRAALSSRATLPMASLAARFHEWYQGAGAVEGDDAQREAAPRDFARRGGAAWPDAALEPVVLASCLRTLRPTPEIVAEVPRTRARRMACSNLSLSECDAVLALVESRIDVTLASLFATPP